MAQNKESNNQGRLVIGLLLACATVYLGHAWPLHIFGSLISC
jgi:hypothetical protein